jgi:penicillin-binding protein 1A
MAWGRKKSGGRKEPLFGLPAALADLRLSPEDRIPAAADDDKPKKSVPKHKPDEDDDEPPPPASASRARQKAAPSGARNRAAVSGSAGWSIGARCSACGRRSRSSAS